MAEGAKSGVVSKDAVVFDLLLLTVFAVFAVTSFEYNEKARSIPLAMGVIGGALTALQLLVDAFPRTRTRLRFVGERGLLGKASAAPRLSVVGQKGKGAGEGPGAVGRGEAGWGAVFRLVLWLFGFVALLAWGNYLVAVGVFTIFVTRVEAKTRWVEAIILAAGVDVSFYLLFQVILGARL